MFLDVKQDVKLAYQSCSGLKKFKNSIKKCKNLEKSCFAVRKEWANKRSFNGLIKDPSMMLNDKNAVAVCRATGTSSWFNRFSLTSLWLIGVSEYLTKELLY